MHYLEFVKPIENILKDYKTKTIKYMDIQNSDIQNSKKIIICGTSLKDNEFIENKDKFSWINKTDKPILGICGGMQIIGLIYKGILKNQTEIGYFHESFTKNFLGLVGDQEVYHLHKNYLDKNSLQKFKLYTKESIPQAIKHNKKEIYGTLFHPEVRNKEMILEFVK